MQMQNMQSLWVSKNRLQEVKLNLMFDVVEKDFEISRKRESVKIAHLWEHNLI